MVLRKILLYGTILVALLLTGMGYFAMTLRPEKYMRPRTWILGGAFLFVLFVVFFLSAMGTSDLETILVAVIFSLFGVVGLVISLWIPMKQREWIRGWFDSQRNKKSN